MKIQVFDCKIDKFLKKDIIRVKETSPQLSFKEEPIELSFKEDQPISCTNWARSRAQKIIRDTSFESDCYNIYDPNFSSEDEISNAKVISGVRPSKIDYLDQLSDISPFE